MIINELWCNGSIEDLYRIIHWDELDGVKSGEAYDESSILSTIPGSSRQGSNPCSSTN